MVDNLAHNGETGRDSISDATDGAKENKGILNRREYILSAATATAVLGSTGMIGMGSGDEGDTEMFVTDFKEYAL